MSIETRSISSSQHGTDLHPLFFSLRLDANWKKRISNSWGLIFDRSAFCENWPESLLVRSTVITCQRPSIITSCRVLAKQRITFDNFLSLNSRHIHNATQTSGEMKRPAGFYLASEEIISPFCRALSQWTRGQLCCQHPSKATIHPLELAELRRVNAFTWRMILDSSDETIKTHREILSLKRNWTHSSPTFLKPNPAMKVKGWRGEFCRASYFTRKRSININSAVCFE